jgi:hypothetical protein
MDVPRSDRSDLETGRLTKNFIDYKRADETITPVSKAYTRSYWLSMQRAQQV